MWFLSKKIMKKEFPVLTTERLILSRPVEGDIQHIIHYLDSDKVYSENTANIPYPYKEADADFLIHEVWWTKVLRTKRTLFLLSEIKKTAW